MQGVLLEERRLWGGLRAAFQYLKGCKKGGESLVGFGVI